MITEKAIVIHVIIAFSIEEAKNSIAKIYKII
jgi:hypothetical protein